MSDTYLYQTLALENTAVNRGNKDICLHAACMQGSVQISNMLDDVECGNEEDRTRKGRV